MKIRTPADILNKVVQDRQAAADRIVEQISEILEDEFIGSPVDIWVHESDQDADAVTKLVAATLYAQGWSLKTEEMFTDPRNGDSIKFIVAPIDSTDPLVR